MRVRGMAPPMHYTDTGTRRGREESKMTAQVGQYQIRGKAAAQLKKDLLTALEETTERGKWLSVAEAWDKVAENHGRIEVRVEARRQATVARRIWREMA